MVESNQNENETRIESLTETIYQLNAQLKQQNEKIQQFQFVENENANYLNQIELLQKQIVALEGKNRHLLEKINEETSWKLQYENLTLEKTQILEDHANAINQLQLTTKQQTSQLQANLTQQRQLHATLKKDTDSLIHQLDQQISQLRSELVCFSVFFSSLLPF